MRHLVVIIIAIVLLTALPAFAQAPKAAAQAPKVAATASKAWAAPKTPWGDPDLQGIWTSDDCIGTPMNRPANFGDRLFYTEEELAQRETTLARQAQNDKQ